MSDVILGLVLAAFLLYILEIFVPGWVLAGVATLCLLLAASFAFTYGTAIGVGALVGVCAVAAGFFLLELRILASGRVTRAFAHHDVTSSATGFDPTRLRQLVGQQGVALTILNPGGKVLVAGQTLPAASRDGLIPKGRPVTIVSADSFRVLVTNAHPTLS